MTNQSKKGFTLVELSIVLVIIGLLIGGILVAQSMINTAKVQALTRQIGQFDAAVANFQTKFTQLPGDNNLFGTAGDNNGTITDTNGATTTVKYKAEIGKVWYDLSQSGLSAQGGASYIDSSTVAAPTSGGMTATLAPLAAAGSNAYFVGFGLSGKNYYEIAQYTFGAAQALTSAPAFKPADVLALDTKLDDGVANAGNVMAQDSTAGLSSAVAGTAACGNTTAYVVATTTNVCEIVVRLGTSTGVLN